MPLESAMISIRAVVHTCDSLRWLPLQEHYRHRVPADSGDPAGALEETREESNELGLKKWLSNEEYGLGFNSQHPQGSSQPFATPAPEVPTPSSGLHRYLNIHSHICIHRHMYTQNE